MAASHADVLQRIRDDCAAVTRAGTRVRIVTDEISAYARALPLDREAVPVFDATHHYRGGEADTVLAVLCLDAVNFGSGWFPKLRKRAQLSGYFTVASSLKDWFTAEVPTPRALASLSVDEVAERFGQTGNADVSELMTLFARALNELGAELGARWSGDPRALVAAADHRAARLVGLLGTLPTFRDVATWRIGQTTREVQFWKRAQLTAVDLALALDGAGLGRFTDLDRLTIFADNLVPHVLRTDGLLSYDPELAAAIEAGELIAPGSPAEVEMRACAVHAVELLVAELGGRASAADLDYLLWNRGQLPRYRTRPRHRTRTTSY